MRNSNNEVIERRIYILDKKINTSCQKNQEGIDEKVKDNNINKKIDRFYLYYINEELEKTQLTKKQIQTFKDILKSFEFNYTKEMLETFSEENKKKIKVIIYLIYDFIKNNKVSDILSKTRKELIFLYDKCKSKEDTILNFYNYFSSAVAKN